MSLHHKIARIFSLLLLIFFLGIVLLIPVRLNFPDSSQNHRQIGGAAHNLGTTSNMECSSWKQVNANGFGLPSEFDSFNQPAHPVSEMPFQSEEGFEVLVFNDQLYLGMEADNLLGARLWRSRPGVKVPQSQLDWEEVAADPKSRPFGISDTAQADHIDSLAEFKDWIFASLANRSGTPKGTLVFRSPNGEYGTWENALITIGPGFGKSQNENFKDMQVFDGYLCGGTWNEINGAEVWCTQDGVNWRQKNASGFGSSQNAIIWSGHVFKDELYFGVEYFAEDGEIRQGRLYRTSSLDGLPVWEEVYRAPLGISWSNILGDLDGYLYISLTSPEGVLVYRSASGDVNTWQVINRPGFENNPSNWGIVADGATIHQGKMYVSVVNGQKQFSLWRTDGKSMDSEANILDWKKISTAGITDPYNIYAQLVSFNGFLYAWTSNPINGQQVWRTNCTETIQE